MSRVGKTPINIPDKVNVTIQGNHVEVQGPLGKLGIDIHPYITAVKENNRVVLTRKNDEDFARSLHGLERARIYNLVKGVSVGFVKELSLIGVGYRAQVTGKKLILQLGFSHDIEYDIPADVQVTIDKQTAITLKGPNKEGLGYVAAEIRSLRPPEPYKGKGVRYKDEHVLRKAGKAAVAGGKKA